MLFKVLHLSNREEQVVVLIRQGKPNKIIAFELGLTTGTIRQYLFHIFRKLGVHNRTELAILQRPESLADQEQFQNWMND